ncbi:uncharacterized protein BT62DRAFT_339099 [Guyanagaster necrorhizus]|uniref:Uncharacterized protein n=1 Tax=Guyanagaster necrorhizus TaxID=856835 RepID=A0A9P8APZ4_9AGAR|nr:uncharacterized protein BT62DRAFT_339099 [Guyanagaster necrorhizus MCA 3950]KAG7443286.1 hypothetical protein BT62DRAFT_339099 [Guyanagaster necrorhizus MCA 3950]
MSPTSRFLIDSLSLGASAFVYCRPYSAIDFIPRRHLSSRIGFGPKHIRTRDNYRIISTLDVARIKDTDIHDLSFFKKPRIQTIVKKKKSSFRVDYATDVLHESSKYLVFPPRTEGFFYYHQQHDSLPGEVRFSLANAGDTGTDMDLLLPNGLPWSLPLWYIASAPKYETLLQKLIEDGLVSSELVQRCRWMFPLAWARRRKRATVLMRWDDMFAVPFDAKCTKLWITGEKAKKEIFLRSEGIFGSYAGSTTGAVYMPGSSMIQSTKWMW